MPSPSNVFGVAAEDQISRRRIERRRANAGDAIEVAHVERIIAAEQHAVGADFFDQEFEDRRLVHDGVVIEPPDRRGRTIGQIHLGFRTHVIGVLEAAGLVGHEAAAVRQADFQLPMPLQDAAEHQAGGGNRGVERQPDEILHVVGRQPLAGDAAMRMDEDERAELFRRRPERFERGIVEIAAVDVGADHGATQAEFGHGPAQLDRGLIRRLQRHAAEADETVGLSFDHTGNLFVLDHGTREPERRLAVVEESEHRRRQHLHVDAVGVHVAQPQAEVPDFRGHRVLHHAAVDLENDLRRADALEHWRNLRRFLGDAGASPLR